MGETPKQDAGRRRSLRKAATVEMEDDEDDDDEKSNDTKVKVMLTVISTIVDYIYVC